MKRLVKTLLIVAGVALVLYVGGTLVVKSIEEKMGILIETELPDVDLGTVPDGTYEGTCDAVAVKVVVHVTVEDGRIEDIVLVEHRNGQGASGEQILETILKEQTMELDTVAGATYSSKAILLAVADAIANRREPE